MIISISLPAETGLKLKQFASAKGKTVSRQGAEAIEEYLERHKDEVALELSSLPDLEALTSLLGMTETKILSLITHHDQSPAVAFPALCITIDEDGMLVMRNATGWEGRIEVAFGDTLSKILSKFAEKFRQDLRFAPQMEATNVE